MVLNYTKSIGNHCRCYCSPLELVVVTIAALGMLTVNVHNISLNIRYFLADSPVTIVWITGVIG